MADRTCLTSPPGALPCIARDPEVRLRDIAASRGITGRSAHGTVTDLAEAGGHAWASSPAPAFGTYKLNTLPESTPSTIRPDP